MIIYAHGYLILCKKKKNTSTWKPFLKFKNDFFAENEEWIFKKLYAPTSKKQDSKEEAEEAV